MSKVAHNWKGELLERAVDVYDILEVRNDTGVGGYFLPPLAEATEVIHGDQDLIVYFLECLSLFQQGRSRYINEWLVAALQIGDELLDQINFLQRIKGVWIT